MRTALHHNLIADNLADLYAYRVSSDPDLVFVKFEDAVLTYGQFDQYVDRMRCGLAAAGLQRGDIVAAFMENSPVLLALLLACARQGLVWAPVNPVSKRRDLAYTLGDLNARLVFADAGRSGLVAEVMPGASVVVVGGRGLLPGAMQRDDAALPASAGWTTLPEWAPERASDLASPAIGPGDPLCVIYSGGTTGMPKGILIPHFYAVSTALRFSEMADFGDDECFFTSLQMFHAWVPLTVLPFCLYYGFPMAFARWWSASEFLNTAMRFGATIVDPPISMVATLLRQPAHPKARDHQIWLLVAALGGTDPASITMVRQLEEQFGLRTLQMYALTEAGPLAITEDLREPRRDGSSGRSRGWYDVQIADAEGAALAPMEQGEILLRPRVPSIMALGYHNKAEQTLKTWRDLWIHTGDEGYLDTDGYLYFVGRKDFFVRRRGEVISVFELEAVLADFPGVSEAAVVAVESELGEDDIKACVVATPGTTADEIYHYCVEQLSYFKIPRYIEIVGELPRSASKHDVERHKLRGIDPATVWDRGDRRAEGSSGATTRQEGQ
jgi:crotonobetaine/carnitine-CoA ligase